MTEKAKLIASHTAGDDTLATTTLMALAKNASEGVTQSKVPNPAEVELAFWEQFKANNFHFSAKCGGGKALAQRWSRYLRDNPCEKDKYDKLVGREAKEDSALLT